MFLSLFSKRRASYKLEYIHEYHLVHFSLKVKKIIIFSRELSLECVKIN